MFFAVPFDKFDVLFGASGLTHVLKRDIVNGEEAHGGTILGSHVGDCGAVGHAHRVHALAEELNELANDTFFTKDLNDPQNHVRRRGSGGNLTSQFEADHFGHQHIQRLAEHVRFCFDTAHTPSEHTETIDHRRVRIRTDKSIRASNRAVLIFSQCDNASEVFQVDLVNDTDVGRDDAEVIERLLAPTQELVAFLVTLEFDLDIANQGPVAAEEVDLDRVVDDQVDRDQRIDLVDIAADSFHGTSHRSEVNHGGHAGEVLQDDAIGLERHLVRFDLGGLPTGEVFDVILRNLEVVAIPQDRFEEHPDGKRQPIDLPEDLAFAGLPSDRGRLCPNRFRIDRVHRIDPQSLLVSLS